MVIGLGSPGAPMRVDKSLRIAIGQVASSGVVSIAHVCLL